MSWISTTLIKFTWLSKNIESKCSQTLKLKWEQLTWSKIWQNNSIKVQCSFQNAQCSLQTLEIATSASHSTIHMLDSQFWNIRTADEFTFSISDMNSCPHERPQWTASGNANWAYTQSSNMHHLPNRIEMPKVHELRVTIVNKSWYSHWAEEQQ